jgi:hypothetical protein
MMPVSLDSPLLILPSVCPTVLWILYSWFSLQFALPFSGFSTLDSPFSLPYRSLDYLLLILPSVCPTVLWILHSWFSLQFALPFSGFSTLDFPFSLPYRSLDSLLLIFPSVCPTVLWIFHSWFSLQFALPFSFKEEFEDTKGVIRMNITKSVKKIVVYSTLTLLCHLSTYNVLRV